MPVIPIPSTHAANTATVNETALKWRFVMFFDKQLFHSWPWILVGAFGFATLFAAAALMVELHFAGVFRFTRDVAGFWVSAFVGYVAVAILIQNTDSPPDDGR